MPRHFELRAGALQRVARALTIGQRIEIAARLDTDMLEWLPSRLEDRDASGEYLTLAWPSDSARRLVSLAPGAVVQLILSTPQDALHTTTARVEQTSATAVPVVIVCVLEPWRRSQRREA